ncbi:hypothetical protein RE6C_03374 [Rhodopirellula europaea 6C]|uniref:Uncharacterized protein n=1 Tax=Rhodopirellula europaea 6C TaxID=1263867 RepID=M2AT50_9BACT|nr:hypothetical protein RE6C_03374 [Rhodopirellula europaea 6C]
MDCNENNGSPVRQSFGALFMSQRDSSRLFAFFTFRSIAFVKS